MQIKLKKDWDQSINVPSSGYRFGDKEKPTGYFVGRKHEVEFLKNDFLRKTNGAILISGLRGVGKTSLVYKAVWEAKLQDKENELIFVFINAQQLNSNNSVEVLKNLIRRLYISFKDNEELVKDLRKKKIWNDLETLYIKATSSTYSDLRKQEERSIFSSKLQLSINLKWFILWVVAFLTFFLPERITLPISNGVMFLNKNLWDAARFLLTIFPLFTLFLNKEKSLEKIATLSYDTDNNESELEFGLEQFQKKIKRVANKKIIYVIDELDKLKGPDNAPPPLPFLYSYKILYTISDAIFVFIGLDNIDVRPIPDLPHQRKGEYTIFDSVYYIPRPNHIDLKQYFDQIVEHKQGDESTLEDFKYLIDYEARNDFFDYKKMLKDKIAYFDSEHKPIIEVVPFTNVDKDKIRFYKAIIPVMGTYCSSKNPSEWPNNQNYKEQLFNHVKRIVNSKNGEYEMGFADLENSLIDILVKESLMEVSQRERTGIKINILKRVQYP